MTTFSADADKTADYIKDANRHGITVLPPDINRSERQFSISEDNEIIFGFGGIKSLKDTSIDNIMSHRPFNSLEELFGKLKKSELDKTSVQSLVLSGAMDALSDSDNRMEILAEAFHARGDKVATAVIDEIMVFSHARKLMYEKKYLGLFLTGHPLDEVSQPTDFEEKIDSGDTFTAMAIVNGIKRIVTKKGDSMAFIRLSFLERDVDAVCFPNLWTGDIQLRKNSPLITLADVLKESLYVKVTGRFEPEGGSFILNHVAIPVRINEGHRAYFEEVETTKGEVQTIPDKVVAPRTTFEDLIGLG